VSYVLPLTLKISTKFEVGKAIRRLAIAFLLMMHYVTLWSWPLTFWPWSVVIHGRRVTWSTPRLCFKLLKILRLSVL